MKGEAADALWQGRTAKYARPPRAAPSKAIEISDVPHRPVDGKEKHWGYQLEMDLSGCNEDVDNPAIVAAYLKEMVQVLKMVAVGEPLVHQFGEDEGGRGTTGLQIITTSHISFHSDDIKWQAYIDVFSCKSFEPPAAIDLTIKYFQPKHLGKKFIYRDAGPWPEK